jgi:predicted nucleotidyltransferase
MSNLAEIMGKQIDKDIIRKLIQKNTAELKTQFKAEVIGIFGSYARGEQSSKSDVDVLVRFDKGATLLDLVAISDYLENLFGIPVDVVSEKSLHPMMRDDVLNELVAV